MIRQIIHIDEELCDGCGLCVNACHEAAIGLVDGKAKLLRDDYCDGLGNCLPVCPTGAISFVQREALAFNEEEVKRNMEEQEIREKLEKEKEQARQTPSMPMGGCPGSRMMSIQRENTQPKVAEEKKAPVSELRQWPVQIQLVPPKAPYFSGADLLVAADCTAFSFGDFHRFMKDKVTIIGCPKLDDVDYSEKLTEILKYNDIQSLTVIRMEVPCCGGIVYAVQEALRKSGKIIPWRVVVISTDGVILDDRG